MEEAFYSTTKNRTVSNFLIVIYTLNPSIWMWDYAALTESLIISGTSLMIYLLINFLKRPSEMTLLATSALILIMIFIRPSSLVFQIVYLAFLIFLTTIKLYSVIKENNVSFPTSSFSIKRHLAFILIGVIPLIIIFGYENKFYEKHGIFTVSGTQIRQEIYNDIVYEVYANNPDREMVECLIKGKEIGTDPWNIMVSLFEFPINRVQTFHYNCIKLNTMKYIRAIFTQMIKNLPERFEARYTIIDDTDYYGSKIALERFGLDGIVIPRFSGVSDLLLHFDSILFQNVNFGLVYAVAFLSLIRAVYLFVKKRSFWMDAGIFSFMTGILLTTFIGQCAEFGRTAICVLPFFYLFVAEMVSEILCGEREK